MSEDRLTGAGWSQALRAKAGPSLEAAFDALGHEASVGLPVMVVLKAQLLTPAHAMPAYGRFDYVAAARAFEGETRQFIEELREAGARDVRLDWISRSVVLKAKPAVLEAIAAHDDVRQIVLDDRHQAMT